MRLFTSLQPLCLSAIAALAIVCAGARDARGVGDESPKGEDPNSPLRPAQARGLDIEERLGLVLPLDQRYTNSLGEEISLGKYFRNEGDHRPAIFVMGYFRCPIVCATIREKLVTSLSKIDYKPGKDYRVLVFSIDPQETPAAAELARQSDSHYFLRELDEKEMDGLQYHTGDGTSLRTLADGLGFKYRKLENNEYSHPVAVFVATPEGKISRYLYGFGQEPKTLRLAIMEASEGKLVKTVGDRLMAFCYMYDPKSGAYTLQAFRVMQVGGVLTVLAISSLVGVLFFGERARRRARESEKRQAKSENSELGFGGVGSGGVVGVAGGVLNVGNHR